VGATEETDAIAVVVSEETQRIAVVMRGRIEEDVSPQRLREVLEQEAGQPAEVPHGARGSA
jgi:hypothetical protein